MIMYWDMSSFRTWLSYSA